MTEIDATLPGVSPPETSKKAGSGERAAVRELVRAARARGEDLTGPDGLLKVIPKTVLESALEEELAEHLGFDKHQGPKDGGNIGNGTRVKTVLTEAAGEVQIEVPGDRAGTFDPQIVRKRKRRLTDVDAVAISLYAKGLTTGEISAHFAEVYGASVSKDRVADHRPGAGGDAGVDQPAAAAGLRRRLHRRDLRQGSGRAGRQPPVLRRYRGRPGRSP